MMKDFWEDGDLVYDKLTHTFGYLETKLLPLDGLEKLYVSFDSYAIDFIWGEHIPAKEAFHKHCCLWNK